MAKIDGKEVLLIIGSNTVTGQVSGSLGITADMLDKTTKDSTAGAKEYIGGETGWTLSIEGLYDPSATEGVSEAIGYLKAGTSLTVLFGQAGVGETYWGGSALISSVNLDGPKNDIASYSLELQGTGVLTEATVPTTTT